MNIHQSNFRAVSKANVRTAKKLKKLYYSARRRLKRRFNITLNRTFDLLVATQFMVLLSPIWALVILSKMFGRKPLQTRNAIGKNGAIFKHYAFRFDGMIAGGVLKRLPIGAYASLLNVISGKMRIVGPRAIFLEEPDRILQKSFRFEVKPGLINPWRLLQKANIAFEPEWQEDLHYIREQNLNSDIGIIVRSLLRLFQNPPARYESHSKLFGIPFENVTMAKAIEQICESFNQPGLTSVSFLNADCVNKALRNHTYWQALKNSNLVYCDGVGVRIAGKWLGCPIRENVNGTDMFNRLCRRLEQDSRRMFLLGGKPGVAEEVKGWIYKHHPKLTVCGTQHGYFADEQLENVLDQIQTSEADIVLVAMGAPKQEIWIQRHLTNGDAKIAIGVGGLFDFYSGNIPRAPKWVREMSLEWVYRLIQEPQRMWKRYLIGNLLFLIRVFREKYFVTNAINHPNT